MFKYFKDRKEIRNIKRQNLDYINVILFTLAEIAVEYQKAKMAAQKSELTTEEAVDILKKLKGLDQKEIVNELVKLAKVKSGE